jgi:CRP-like cAMP-binding protein
VAELAAELGESQHAGGTFVFRRGDSAARVHVVRRGTMELSRVINGRRVAMQILRPGDVFGDVPAFLGEPEPFDARAVEDCTVLSLEATSLLALLQARPQVARRWILSLAERMSGLQHRLGDLLAGGLDAQLASILPRESDDGEVQLTQDQLAEMVGAARTSVQRVLKTLEAGGLLELGYRRIAVLDPGGLVGLIGDGEAAT